MPQFIPLGEVRPTPISMPQPTDYSVIAQRQAATRGQQLKNQAAQEQREADKIIASEILPKSINTETGRIDYSAARQMASQDPRLGTYGLGKIDEALKSQSVANQNMLKHKDLMGQLGVQQINASRTIANDPDFEVVDQPSYNAFKFMMDRIGLENVPKSYEEGGREFYNVIKNAPETGWYFDPESAKLKNTTGLTPSEVDKYLNMIIEGGEDINKIFGKTEDERLADPTFRMLANARDNPKMAYQIVNDLSDQIKSFRLISRDVQLEEETRPGKVQTAKEKAYITAIQKMRGEHQGKIATGEWSKMQLQSAGFALQMEGAMETLDQLKAKKYNPAELKNFIMQKNGWELVRDPDTAAYVHAVKAFVNGILRDESGAAITEYEYDRYVAQYFPKLNEPLAVQEAKEDARMRAWARMMASASGAYDLAKKYYVAKKKSVGKSVGKKVDEILRILEKDEEE